MMARSARVRESSLRPLPTDKITGTGGHVAIAVPSSSSSSSSSSRAHPTSPLRHIAQLVPLSFASSSSSSLTTTDILTAAVTRLDQASLHTALRYYYTQYHRSEAEKEALRAEMQERDEDAMRVIHELEGKLSHILNDAAHYRQEVTALLESRAAAERALHTHYHALLQERDTQLQDYARLTAHLQDDVRQASVYAKQHQDHERELQVMRSCMSEQSAAHQRELSVLRFQTVDTKMKLLALESTMQSRFGAELAKASDGLLAQRHGDLLQRNAALEEERVRMMSDVHALMQVTERMHAERAAMRRGAELQAQTHRGVLHRLVWGNRQSREMDRQLQQVEAQLRACQARQRAGQRELQDVYEARLTAMRQELESVRASLHVHRRELTRMRALAAAVVSQRGELERFFYAALQDCRRYRAGLQRSARGVKSMGTAGTTRSAICVTTRGTASSRSRRPPSSYTARDPARGEVSDGHTNESSFLPHGPMPSSASARSAVYARTFLTDDTTLSSPVGPAMLVLPKQHATQDSMSSTMCGGHDVARVVSSGDAVSSPLARGAKGVHTPRQRRCRMFGWRTCPGRTRSG